MADTPNAQAIALSRDEIDVLRRLLDFDYRVYLEIRFWADFKSKRWATNWGGFCHQLGDRNKRGEIVRPANRMSVRNSIVRLIREGLVVKTAEKGRDGGIVLECPKIPSSKKNGDTLMTLSSTHSVTQCMTHLKPEKSLDLPDDLEGGESVNDIIIDPNNDIITNENVTPLTSNKENPNTNIKILNARVPRETLGQSEDLQQADVLTSERPRQLDDVADKGIVEQRGTYASATKLGGTYPTQEMRELSAETGGGELTEHDQTVAELTRWFKVKPGMTKGSIEQIGKGTYRDTIEKFLNSGLTLDEIKSACLLNDEERDKKAFSPAYYEFVIARAAELKKNPPTLSSGAGKLSFVTDKGKHHDRKRRPSQRLVDMPQNHRGAVVEKMS